jgi:hypothetical protein
VIAVDAMPAPAPAPAPKDETTLPAREPQESFVSSFLWRFGTCVVALGVVIGLWKLLVVLSEDGAKWPQAIIIALGVVGILASPFVLYFRLRRLWRFLFARDGDG